MGASVSIFEGCATITDALTTYQLDSARWLFLHSLLGALLQEEFSTKVHEWTQSQQLREAHSQYHSFTWQVLRAAADSIGAKTLYGAFEHLRSVIKGSTDKDSPAWDEVKRDAAFWGGTETGLLGLLTTDDQVFACDGSLADSALGGGAFCLTTGQSRYARVAEGQDTDSSARAEILAAIIAVNWCLDPSLDIGTPAWIYDCTPKARSDMRTRRVVILTDCQVLLDTVEQWTDEGPRPSLRNRPNGDLLDVLFRKLHAATASDILTVFVKVKAHRGDPANELADAAADMGRTYGALVQPTIWPQLMYSLRPSDDGADAATDLRPRRAGPSQPTLVPSGTRYGTWAGSFCSCSLWFPINT